MEWTQEQLAELTATGHRHQTPGTRVKALAVLAVAKGQTREAVAITFDVSRVSVGKWVQEYRQEGLEAFPVAAGRGRKPEIDLDELARIAEQSPRNFGINRTRWTVPLLASVVPSAQGKSTEAVRRALHRRGLGYKRGQPWMLSPDPEYEKKSK
jgi:transposase